MVSPKSEVYFGCEESDKLVSFLSKKSEAWFQSLTSSDYLDKIKRSWQSYHGQYYENSHAVNFGGESGELVNLAVNHYRNIGQNILTMVTSTRPSFQARAVNTDLKSQIQTNLANGLLEYYMRDKRLEQDLRRAVEYAVVLGSGYIKMEWNSTSGEIYDMTDPEVDVDPTTGEETVVREGYPIYQGDVEFTVLSPFDVVFDTTKETPKMDWQLCRSFKNKFDIAEKFAADDPALYDEIVGVRTKSEQANYRISLTPFDETSDVPVYEFFHKPTESLPRGRYVLYLTQDIVLVDTVLPYRKLPIFRISASDILGTPYGYTSMFDLLPIQDAVNSLYSTILTNQHTFGVQNIVSERDAGLTMTQLAGGLNHIEINPGSSAPQALNLTQTPGEIFNFLQMLERSMEVISGINSVARGNPDPKQNLRSGNALALIQSQALQFISGLQQSYIHLIEDVGTNLITLLQDFASVPRIAQISGKSNATYMKEFTGDDLNSITRVIVDAGNALAQTTAGRSEMATQMMQMNLIKTPEEYLSVINTGKLETMTESQNKQLLLIRAENERLTDGKVEVMAILTDDHNLHLREHQAVLADPDLRMDPQLVQRALTHIQEHINILSDPNNANILLQMGQQPIAPPMMPPAPMPAQGAEGQGGAGPTDLPPGAPEAGLMNDPAANSPELQAQMVEQLPQPAQPAENPTGAPTTAQDQFARLIGG
jgi:hypothetical protein